MTIVHGAGSRPGERVEEWRESWTELEHDWRVECRAHPTLMTIHDSSGRVLYVTPSARHLLGMRDEAELLDRSFLTMVHPDDAGRVRRAFCGWLSGRAEVAVTLRVSTGDGTWRTLQAIGTCDRSAAAGPTVVVTARERAAVIDDVRPGACGGRDARSRRTPRRSGA